MKDKNKKWAKRVWAGFVDGRPHRTLVDTGFGGWGDVFEQTIIIFTDKRRAKRHYSDVRPMRLTNEEEEK